MALGTDMVEEGPGIPISRLGANYEDKSSLYESYLLWINGYGADILSIISRFNSIMDKTKNTSFQPLILPRLILVPPTIYGLISAPWPIDLKFDRPGRTR